MIFRKKIIKPLEHSGIPSFDYAFAIERYTEFDNRYLFIQYFCKLFFEKTGIEELIKAKLKSALCEIFPEKGWVVRILTDYIQIYKEEWTDGVHYEIGTWKNK